GPSRSGGARDAGTGGGPGGWSGTRRSGAAARRGGARAHLARADPVGGPVSGGQAALSRGRPHRAAPPAGGVRVARAGRAALWAVAGARAGGGGEPGRVRRKPPRRPRPGRLRGQPARDDRPGRPAGGSLAWGQSLTYTMRAFLRPPPGDLMGLDEWRTRIDEIDRQLLGLLNQRAELSVEIGRAKRESGGPILVPEREQEILDEL